MSYKPEKKVLRRELPPVNASVQQGLSRQEVQQRLSAGWDNRTSSGVLRTEKQIILQNCITFFNSLFLIMAALLILAGSSIIKLAFMVVVIINTTIGCVQEIRAKRAVEKLTLVAARTVPAIREGAVCPTPSHLLVRDDIVEFSAGDQICADGILRSGQLLVNEALITGEPDAIEKNPGDTLLSGSFAVAGRGRVQLTRVGNDAYAAKLAAEAKKDPKVAKSEMMRSLDKLIRVLGVLLIPIGAALFYKEFFLLQRGLQSSAEATAAALVGMIPEGLYLLTSVALAVSSIQLTKKRVLVQDMNCIESLARVDVLCVDKTGTITESAMELENIIPLTQDPPEYLEAVITALYGSREPENETGRVLQEMFPGPGSWQEEAYIPFTSQTKWSGGIFRDQGAFLVGAPECILKARYDELRPRIEPLLKSGCRVLLVARYEGIPSQKIMVPQMVTPLALICLANRIRPDAAKTFAYFRQQGVCIKVLSGDNPETVSAVAARAGIENAELWVDAGTLETDEDVYTAAAKYTVFGRVTPDKKQALIRALKAQKHTVAMTGDGVNDVLAMKEADCGIAMASGAQAACQVARLVLLDSDFTAMPAIVGEGRRVINNIQRAAALFLVKNIFSLGFSLLSLLTGWPYPLEPQHMSIISGLTIGVPSFFLAMEPNYQRVQGRFLPGVLRRAFPGGLTDILVVLAATAFMTAFSLPLEQVSTVCTAILAVVGMAVLFGVCKPFDKFRAAVWGAMILALAVCFTLLSDIFELHLYSTPVLLVMATLLIMIPTVYFVISRIFTWGDKLWARLSQKQSPAN